MLCYEAVGQWETAIILDNLKETGFRYATKAGVTFSFGDIIVPKKKEAILEASEKEVNKIFDLQMKGGITENERFSRVVDQWKRTSVRVTDVMMEELSQDRKGFELYIHDVQIRRSRQQRPDQAVGRNARIDG